MDEGSVPSQRPATGLSQTQSAIAEEDDWDLSPYTFERLGSSPSARRLDLLAPFDLQLSPSEGDEGTAASGTTSAHASPSESGNDVILSLPPTYYRGLFPGADHPDTDATSDMDSDSDEDDLLLLESSSVRDDRTMFGRALTIATVSQTQSISFEGNKEQAANGAKILDEVTRVPLSEFWHIITQVFFLGVFVANVIVALIDVILSPTGLHFKVTGFVMGLAENVVLLAMWLYVQYRKRKDGPNDSFTKHQQYIENILHEVLLYPIIIMATLGFSSDKMYTKPSSALAWIQVILLTIDVLDLLWTQAMRLYMIYQIFQDISGVLEPDKKETTKSCSGSGLAGGLLTRAYATIVGNAVLFLLMVFVLGAQMNYDNLQSTDPYRMSYRSGLQAFCLIVLPLYSMFMFVVANSYWVMELFIMLNLKVGTSTDFTQKFESDLVVSEAVGFCMNKAETTKDRLADIKSLPTIKKVMYGLSEAPVILLLMVWFGLVSMVLFSFGAFDNQVADMAVVGAFALVAIIANYQLFALVVTMLVLTPLLAAGLAVYPFFVMICFWKKQTIEPDEEVEVVTLGVKEKYI